MYLIKKESNAVLKTWTGGASACNTVAFHKAFVGVMLAMEMTAKVILPVTLQNLLCL